MKKWIACLLPTLMLSLLLCGCSDRMPGGMVTSSPVPATATPALPIPSSAVDASPLPETSDHHGAENGSGNDGGSSQVGDSTNTETPQPSSAAR